jgi:Mn2+/Fe2+ NRAMP family transporter
MVMGPGLVVMEADNDAGAVATYAQTGGQYGLHLLPVLLIPSLSKRWVVRLGIAPGEGHAAMIYLRFGPGGSDVAARSACTSSTC